MRRLLATVIENLSYLFIGGDKNEFEAIPFKEKLHIVMVWTIALIFCLVMLKLFLG